MRTKVRTVQCSGTTSLPLQSTADLYLKCREGIVGHRRMLNYAGGNTENPEQQEDFCTINHEEGINSLFISKEIYAMYDCQDKFMNKVQFV